MPQYLNEILFYGGLAVAALSAVGLLVSLLVAKLRAMKLEQQLTAEYGPKRG